MLISLLMLLPTLAMVPWPAASQTDPPPFGQGDWLITDETTIKDGLLKIRGNINIAPGGSLTLDNTTLLLDMDQRYDERFFVSSGGSCHIKNGSFLGAFDETFVIYAAPHSTLRISNSTISNVRAIAVGSTDLVVEDSTIKKSYYGITLWGGTVEVHRSRIVQSNYGIWNLHGNAGVHNSTLAGNDMGVYEREICGDLSGSDLALWAPPFSGPIGNRCSGPRTATVEDSLLSDSLTSGVYLYSKLGTSSAIIRNNIITRSNNHGVSLVDSSAVIEDNVFIDNVIGVGGFQYQGTPSAQMVNNDFLDCSDYGVYFDKGGGGSWNINDEVSIDSPVLIRTPINVQDGGNLWIDGKINDSLPIAPGGIIVKEGGTAYLEGVEFHSGWGAGFEGYIKGEEGSSIRLSNSTFREMGKRTGDNIELSGIYSAGEMVLENSTVRDSYYGTASGGGQTVVTHVSYEDCEYGVASELGDIDVHDSTITGTLEDDVETRSGTVDLYNTTYDEGKYKVSDGVFSVHWDCTLHTMWQNGEPLGNVSFNISETGGGMVAEGVTGPGGVSGTIAMREFSEDEHRRVWTTPHNITGWTMNMTNSTNISVHESRIMDLYIQDSQVPGIEITSHGPEVFLTNNTITLKGHGWDDQSGLDRVQWSLDRDLWNDVNITSDGMWNTTVVLEYGVQMVHMRALDRAGNENVSSVRVIVDKEIPYLVVTSPEDGLLVNLMTVLVEGYVEPGATVSVRGMSLLSEDGVFRMSVPVDEGRNDLEIVATDPTGNTNSTTITVWRDTTPPTIDVRHPPEDYVTNSLGDQSLLVQGTVEPDALFKINGIRVQLAENGSFTFTIGLDRGVNVLNFYARDTAGNQNTTIRKVLFDLTPPDLNILTPEDGAITNRTSAQVSGITEPGVLITVNNGQYRAGEEAGGEGSFDIEIGLSEGLNTLSIMATDQAGNEKSVTVSVQRDSVSPEIDIMSVSDGMVVSTSRILVEGMTERSARMKIDRELVDVGLSGRFSKWVDLPSANNTITFEAVDEAGNRNETVIHIKRKIPEKDTGSQTASRADHLPLAVIIAVAILVVQWILLARHVRRMTSRQDSDAAIDEEEGLEDFEGGQGRVVPRRRSRHRVTRRPRGSDEPEFDEIDEIDEIEGFEGFDGSDGMDGSDGSVEGGGRRGSRGPVSHEIPEDEVKIEHLDDRRERRIGSGGRRVPGYGTGDSDTRLDHGGDRS